MQVEVLPALGGVLMRKEERVLSWVEPGGGGRNSFPKERGVQGGALTPHFQAALGGAEAGPGQKRGA